MFCRSLLLLLAAACRLLLLPRFTAGAVSLALKPETRGNAGSTACDSWPKMLSRSHAGRSWQILYLWSQLADTFSVALRHALRSPLLAPPRHTTGCGSRLHSQPERENIGGYSHRFQLPHTARPGSQRQPTYNDNHYCRCCRSCSQSSSSSQSCRLVCYFFHKHTAPDSDTPRLRYSDTRRLLRYGSACSALHTDTKRAKRTHSHRGKNPFSLSRQTHTRTLEYLCVCRCAWGCCCCRLLAALRCFSIVGCRVIPICRTLCSCPRNSC